MKTRMRPLKGLKEAQNKLTRAQGNLYASMEDFTEREARELLAIIKDEWVPVDKGGLRRSGRWMRIKVNQSKARRTRIEFNKSYAWKQHENLDFKHRVGSSQYVLRPLVRKMNGMSTRLVTDIRSRYKS